ncbi:MAG: pyridoxamine 5'-phosphate oxidase family protein [Reyranellaceae bacterium]
MASWSDLQAAAPALAAFGRQRLECRVGYLATLRADGAPRLHPVSPFIGDGLYVYMAPGSPKVTDLRRDPRYALHGAVEDDSGGEGEFCIDGRAVELVEAARRTEAFAAARAVGYRPGDRHVVFELRLARVLATTYGEGRRRERWSPPTRP